MMGSVGSYGRVGSYGAVASYGAASTAGSPAVADFYGTGGYAYRVFMSGTNTWFQVIRAPAGYATGTLVYASNVAAWNAINREYRDGRQQLSPFTIGAVTTGSSALPKPAPGSSGKMGGGVVPADQGKPKWYEVFAGVTTALTPLIPGVVQLAQNAGSSGSPTALAGKIAAKQQKLANTTNPVTAAKLRADIASLQQEQAMYGQAVAAGLADTSGGYSVDTGGVQQGAPSWLWPVVIVGGLVVLGGGAYALSQEK